MTCGSYEEHITLFDGKTTLARLLPDKIKR